MSKEGKHISQRERKRRARQAHVAWREQHPREAQWQDCLNRVRLRRALGIGPERPWERQLRPTGYDSGRWV